MEGGVGAFEKSGRRNSRLLTDAVAPFYTLVLESTYLGLAEFESFHKKATANADWKKWYEKFIPLVESGRREIFNIVE